MLSPAQAETQRERLLYEIMLGGLHIGDSMVTFSQSPDAYRTSLSMTSRGMLQWMQNFSAGVSSEGQLVGSATDAITPVPLTYRRAWTAPEMASTMTMHFDPRTGLATSEEKLFNPATGATLTPEDMPWNTRRSPLPDVPEKLRLGAMDPVAAFVSARLAIRDAGKSEVRVPIYDGRRRYDIISTASTPRSYTIRDQTHDVVPVTSRVEPVFGFEPDAEDRMREGEGKVLFSNDERFVPLQVILGNSMFSSVMNLVADCERDPAACAAITETTEDGETASN
ncbi:MAG: DUF3108 domain-containing protein [Rhodobacteraceae bacterium]|nr:DUF3108 domain-containing protein [Paracoccaceae bacterium]